MADSSKAPWPTELRLKPGGKALVVTFNSGETFEFTAEFLRVESPSAEVQGHSREQRQWIGGKKDVAIREIKPVGNYAARLVFSDGHATGIFPWATLYRYGREHDTIWQAYLSGLAKLGLKREA